MPSRLSSLCAFLVTFLTPTLSGAEPWVSYVGNDGPGAGKTVVLVSGDEEYRSEEALPQLGRILSFRHGFTCHVLFAIDRATGEINPDDRTNIPGLEKLVDADLMIIATRFRDLPDEQMRHIDAYLKSGRPVVGLRTATHAFSSEGSKTYEHYNWNYGGEEYKQGFGRQVLGETWIAHHGAHGKESTRGIVAPNAIAHPIVRGIEPGNIWGPTDVYRVRLPLPAGCTPIVLGAVLEGMGMKDAVLDDPKNDPMMPIAWTKTPAADGPAAGQPGRVFTTTMGAANDLLAEGTRRMLVNGVYWALEMDDRIPSGGTDVDLVGGYAPSNFAFGGFRRGFRPEAYAYPRTASLEITSGSRIVVVGNTFAERLAQSGAFDPIAHAAFPGDELVIRHVPWSADEVGFRPREHSVPTMEDWLDRLEADVVFLFFGMSESFAVADAGTAEFEEALGRLIASHPTRQLVLVSPIAHENLGPPWDETVDIAAHNDALSDVTAVMKRVAAAEGVTFVDLFEYSRDQYLRRRGRGPLTTNGIHPTEAACAVFMGEIANQLGWTTGGDAAADAAAVDAARALACDKHYYFRLHYRATNSEYVWGRRHKPYGVVNFPPELRQLDRMTDAREQALRAMSLPGPAAIAAHLASAAPQWMATPTERTFPADRWTPKPVEAKGTETSLGDLTIDDPDIFLESFTVADGYVIECFASEQDFPELVNPLAMTFDDQHRLWVLCTATYPHLLPGDRAKCKLIILEDTDGDGHADERIVFADGLYIPTGFAVDPTGVYIGQAPDLFRFVDTDGDDRADEREIVMSGFGMPDSHHTISAFEWDPTGGLLLHEGVFTKTNIETPYGTRRADGAAVWRFDPRTQRAEILSHPYYNNPWGHAFDDYGASILADASGGDNYDFSHVALPFDYPHKPRKPKVVSNRGRPTAGCELIASRHFPDDVQDSFLVNQCIGFHGTRWDRMTRKDSTWATEAMPQDLVDCSDVNFRPVAMEIGPDGALYIADWCNPIVGHMQYSVRDPRRDHTHGRIWRVRHAKRPLVEPPDIAGASMMELLRMLRLPERNTRQLARRRLQTAPWMKVLEMLTQWSATLSPGDPDYDRMILEDLWIRHTHGRAPLDIVERAFGLDEPRVRAGAVRVLRHMLQARDVSVEGAADLLERAVHDDSMRVRLEGVVASGFLPAPTGLAIAAGADLHEMDEAMEVVFGEVLSYLAGDSEDDAVPAVVERIRLERMPVAELLARPLDEIGAGVRLIRSDLADHDRTEALEHLAGPDPVAQAEHLVASLDTARNDGVTRALGGLLVALPGAGLAAIPDAARAMMEHPSPARRAVGVAALLRTGGVDAGTVDPAVLVAASALLKEDAAPTTLVPALRTALTSERVDADLAITEIVRHTKDHAQLRPWLETLAGAVDGAGFDPWTPAHETAMAAIRGLQELAASAEGDDRYRVEPVAKDRHAAGRALYLDEERGCARCHGIDGQGLEGFPPLARSPWIVGDARRAAEIVTHGLYGRIRMPDGRLFNSVMAPLGANLDDDEVAQILTYVRQSWGNYASTVAARDVAGVREGQFGPWEAQLLLAKYPFADDAFLPPPATIATPAAATATPANGAAANRRSLIWLIAPLAIIALIVFVLVVRRSSSRPG